MTTAQTQASMYYQAEKRAANVNTLFLELVADGMTREELARNIERRPALWGRFDKWIAKLPSQAQQQVTSRHGEWLVIRNHSDPSFCENWSDHVQGRERCDELNRYLAHPAYFIA